MRFTLPLVCLAAVTLARPSSAQELTFHIEPAAAFWVDKPQDRHFTPAFALALRPGVIIGPMATVQLSYALLYAWPGEGFENPGSSQSVMGGLRLRPLAPLRSNPSPQSGLFIDANLGWVRTGGLDRLGFDAGLGFAGQLTDRLTVGPVFRYAQIVQNDDDPRVNPDDAQSVSIGLDIGFGPTRQNAPEADEVCPPDDTVCPEVDDTEETVTDNRCVDSDRDGVCNTSDRCPNEIGPPATLGCPIDPCSGKPLRVLVQFEYDSAQLPVPQEDNPQSMDPILNAVAKAIAQDPSCRVCILGNASEEGADDYNQELSLRRADAVAGYLTARGLESERLPTIGLGSRCPLVPESSRLLNRRVEFHRLQEGESCSAVCAE